MIRVLAGVIHNATEVIATVAHGAKIRALYFDITSEDNSTEWWSEPARGIMGVIKNTMNSRGILKAINVAVRDNNWKDGALAARVYEASLFHNPKTKGAAIYSGSLSGIGDGVGTAAEFRSTGSQWKNGVVFEQGDEFADSVLQASMGDGSGDHSCFVKLKAPDGSIKFKVNKHGHVKTSVIEHHEKIEIKIGNRVVAIIDSKGIRNVE